MNMEFIVLTCDKYLDTRVKSIRETWGKDKNITFLSDTTTDIPNVLGFNTQQDYSGIFLKYYYFFSAYDFTRYDYYFFTDDDTFIHLKNLEKLDLPSKDEPFCIGRVGCLNPDGTDISGNQTGTNVSLITGDNVVLPLYYPGGGAGFILSQSACNLIQKYLNSEIIAPNSKFSDVSVGFWIRNSGVNLINNENFWWDNHEKLKSNTLNYTSDENVITHHYVDEKLMVEYHKKYNQI